MAEIRHPQIDFGNALDGSMQQTFAGHAFELLEAYGIEYEDVTGNYFVTYSATEPVDGWAENGEQLSVRVKSEPTFSAERQDEFYPSLNDYHVMHLEYGYVTDENGISTEGEGYFEWQDYIAIITKRADPLEVDVVDMRTGRQLEAEDIFVAEVLLGKMQVELRAMNFEDALENPFRVACVQKILAQYFDENRGEMVGHVSFDTDIYIDEPNLN